MILLISWGFLQFRYFSVRVMENGERIVEAWDGPSQNDIVFPLYTVFRSLYNVVWLLNDLFTFYVYNVCLHIGVGTMWVLSDCRGPEGVWGPSLELLTESHMWVLRTKLGHSVRAMNVLKLRAASLSPLLLAEVKWRHGNNKIETVGQF